MDESSCAECSFENGMCGWADVSNNGGLSYWRVTSLGAGGNVLSLGFNIVGSAVKLPTARVQTPVLGPSDAACAVSFRYYIYSDYRPDDLHPYVSLMSLQLVLVKRAGAKAAQEFGPDDDQLVLPDEKVIFSTNNDTDWQSRQAVVLLGPLLRLYKLEFRAVQTLNTSTGSISQEFRPQIWVDNITAIG